MEVTKGREEKEEGALDPPPHYKGGFVEDVIVAK